MISRENSNFLNLTKILLLIMPFTQDCTVRLLPHLVLEGHIYDRI